jgi:hypothetical protein
METQIVEGTYADVQQRLIALHLKPETHVRVVITEAEPSLSVNPFLPTEFRNGLPLLPRRELPEPITLELVKRLLEPDDEEMLVAYRTPGR